MKKKPKQTTLSRKLLLSLLAALCISVMAVNFIGYLISQLLVELAAKDLMYISQLFILILIIILFYKIVDKTILQRLGRLSKAMAEVADGNYQISVPVSGNDELSKLTESFNQMTKELQANAFLSKEFTRYVSHEYKTPLAVIRNYAELTRDCDNSAATVQNMDVIITETDRLTELSKDILQLCKLDSTTIIEKKDRFYPAGQIRSVILDLQLLWNEKNIEMIVELEEFEITSNETLLFRVWQNLIGNAIKFSKQNGTVTVRLKQYEDWFTVEVIDNGVGITSEEKQHIFTPFYYGHRFLNQEGSGLGLSLSKKIIEKLNGTISFESSAGIGSIFTINLPY
ncbi:MAG: ATP-binding protein [Erysipelotrichaceae bacterium]